MNYIKKRERSTKKKSNAREIRGIAVFFSILFLVMAGYLCYYLALNEEALFNNSYNSRQQVLMAQNQRGMILANDGTVLARSVILEDGSEERVYPYEEQYAHIVGYSTYGRMGIEELCNYDLLHSDVSLAEQAANAAVGTKNPGNNVYTTLDPALQETAYEVMKNYEGAVIVTEVKTGKILAMVSKPDFDPNQIEDIWEKLVADEESSVLVNRATQGLYPPGSTFKIITALEYIRENPEDYQKYSFECTGSYLASGSKISCYHGSVHKTLDFYKSFAKSCNASFANMGLQLDRISFADTLEGLLFEQELPYDMRYSKSSTVIDGETDNAQLMQTSIGQGKTLMSPLHLHMITSAVANNGVLMKPYVVDRVESADGKELKTYTATAYGSLMTEAESSILQEMMTQVVESGTATKLSGSDYTAAGKTGSAEYSSNKSESHAWFTGFAPAEDPQIAVTVIVEEVGSGGEYAVPLVKKIMDAYFQVSNN